MNDEDEEERVRDVIPSSYKKGGPESVVDIAAEAKVLRTSTEVGIIVDDPGERGILD